MTKSMKKIFAVLLLTLPFILGAKPDLNANEQGFIKYYESGSYNKELTHAYHKAERYLTKKIKTTKNPAIVFDIDETVLSNYPNMKELKFTRNHAANAVAYAKGENPAIEPALKLFKFAKDNNVTIFFITGRPDSKAIFDATVNNLNKVGFSGWKKLYLRPLTDNNHSVVGYKSGIRKKITEDGYHIILNIGDQASDLAGGYAEKQIKLPNPFYTLY